MDSLDKKYYRIAEVAELVGVPQSTLRFWEKEFPQV
ncbi:MAG: MerR family transcriptional regulator, partial [Muribaculaceae bacterium]|nr:MerR family transcriptional regulator [Muribaculaceae bacterium]